MLSLDIVCCQNPTSLFRGKFCAIHTLSLKSCFLIATISLYNLLLLCQLLILLYLVLCVFLWVPMLLSVSNLVSVTLVLYARWTVCSVGLLSEMLHQPLLQYLRQSFPRMHFCRESSKMKGRNQLWVLSCANFVLLRSQWLLLSSPSLGVLSSLCCFFIIICFALSLLFWLCLLSLTWFFFPLSCSHPHWPLSSSASTQPHLKLRLEPFLNSSSCFSPSMFFFLFVLFR